ncbi:MAG: hypothetical protein AABX84_01480 [Nanoarchaeota archaeon]
MAEKYSGRIVSHKKQVMRTDYSQHTPSAYKPRFIPITLAPKPIIPIYTDELAKMRDEFLKRRGLKNTMKEKGLEKKLEIAVAFGSIIVSMLYFSTNATGLAIQNLNQTDINIVGAIFFVFGVLLFLSGLRK